MSETDKIMRFMQSQTIAKKLIQEDAKNDSKRITKSNNNGWFEEFTNENRSYDDYDSYIKSSDNFETNINYIDTIPTNNKTPKNKTSKLPKEILDSILSNPIDGNKSVLDSIYNFDNTNDNNNTKNTSNIKNNIDYDMIKNICDDVVKKYASALRKSILNEVKNISNNELKAMKIGNTFSFIDENGNIYEAKLTLKGNVNKK